MVLLLKDMMCNNSALKCLKTNRNVVPILFSYAAVL